MYAFVTLIIKIKGRWSTKIILPSQYLSLYLSQLCGVCCTIKLTIAEESNLLYIKLLVHDPVDIGGFSYTESTVYSGS